MNHVNEKVYFQLKTAKFEKKPDFASLNITISCLTFLLQIVSNAKCLATSYLIGYSYYYIM